MIKVIIAAFLPAVIVYVMIKLFRDSLLKDGNRTKIIIFFLLCALIYAVSILVIALA